MNQKEQAAFAAVVDQLEECRPFVMQYGAEYELRRVDAALELAEACGVVGKNRL